MKRFYSAVSTQQGEDGWMILLDGKPVKDRSGHVIVAPSKILADHAASEWEQVSDVIDMRSMTATRLIGAAAKLDASDRLRMVDDMVGYAQTDLLCYWDQDPDLLREQQLKWGPVLQAVERHLGVSFVRTCEIHHAPQSHAAMTAVREAVESWDDFHLVAASQMVGLLGSVLLFVGWQIEAVSDDAAMELAQLEEVFQATKWGEDGEAALMRHHRTNAFLELAQFWRLLDK